LPSWPPLCCGARYSLGPSFFSLRSKNSVWPAATRSAALGLRRLRRLLDLAIFCPAEYEESSFREN